MRRFSTVIVFLLSLMALAGALDGKLIVIDPGHGGPDDRGAVTERGLEEAVINLKVALYLREMLEEEGAIVVMTRTTDRAVSLKERVDLANRLDADLFLCLHHNYMETNPSADFSIVYFPSRSMDYSINLAHILAEEFEKYVGTKPGDIGPGDVYVMRNLKVPGILGEPCLMSNPKREEWLRKDENLKKEARAYFQAVLKLFSLEIPNLKLKDEIVSQKVAVESDKPLKKAWAYFENTPLNVRIDGHRIEIEVPPKIEPGEHELTVFAMSEDNIYSRSLRKKVVYKPVPGSLVLKVLPGRAPALPGSYYVVEFEFSDRGRKLALKPHVRLSGGFYQLEDSRIYIPYFGEDRVTIEVGYGNLKEKLDLEFSGKDKVRVLILKDEKGKIIDILEYRGGKLKIEKEGFETLIYESELEDPVSFETITLKRTITGILKGRKVGIAFHPEFEDVVKRIAEKLEKFGCEIELSKVSTMRDEFKTARSFNKKDAVVLVGPENWQTRLKKLLKVPHILVSSEESIVEKLSKILSR